MSACLFALNLVFFLWHSQGWGGREGDSLGEWWVGAVGREMGTVALGWVAGPVHAAAQSKQASKESRVEMWRCGISAAEFWGSHDDMNYGVGSVSTLAKSCFIFGFWTGFTWFFPRKSGFRHTGSETTLISNYIEMILKSS
jgi:hypothetical protein